MEFLFAQATEAASNAAQQAPWAQIFGGVTTTGIVSWLVWHLVTKAIPDMQKTHAENIKTVVQEFRSETKEQRQAEQIRAATSVELARSGHDAMSEVTRAVNSLQVTLDRHGLKAEKE